MVSPIEILKFVVKKGRIEPNEIKAHYNLSLNEVHAMLEELKIRGYIEYFSPFCEELRCNICGVRNSCPYANLGIRFYKITKKGLEVYNKVE